MIINITYYHLIIIINMQIIAVKVKDDNKLSINT